MPLAWISLTLSRHFPLSFVASGRSSGLHPVSSHSCCMYVRAGRPAFARPYVGVHRSTSLMSSSLLLQQCPACLVRLIWIVFVMAGRWPYSWCFVGVYIYIYIYIVFLVGLAYPLTWRILSVISVFGWFHIYICLSVERALALMYFYSAWQEWVSNLPWLDWLGFILQIYFQGVAF